MSFSENGKSLSRFDVREIAYEVFGGKVAATHPAKPDRTLIAQIDCSTQAPDYYGGGNTLVTRSVAGPYRESGGTDWKGFQNLNPSLRKVAPEPSWFA